MSDPVDDQGDEGNGNDSKYQTAHSEIMGCFDVQPLDRVTLLKVKRFGGRPQLNPAGWLYLK